MIRAASPDLVKYLAEFELGLHELAPHQVSMFVAGRNATEYVEGLETPVGTQLSDSGDADRAEIESERGLHLTAYDEASLESRLPADEMDVRPVDSPEDLPRVFPVQWLYEEVWPDLFYAKLAHRELLMPEWQRPVRRPRDPWDDLPDRELRDEKAAADSARLHAYVLLDTSSTMQDRDRRGTVARGLALEFLRKSYGQGARLHLRPFAVDVGALSSGVEKEDLRALTRRIIDLPNAGQTRIQTALEQAVRDIRGEGPCLGASIVLITDGISRLTKNPLAGEALHTFILGDLFDEQRAAGAIDILKQWSHSFHRVWKPRFAELLAPRWDDCQSAAGLLQTTLDDLEANAADYEADALRRLLDNVRSLVREFKRFLDKKAAIPPEVRAMEERLKELERRVAQAPSPVAGRPEPYQADASTDTPAAPQQGPVPEGRATRGPASATGEKLGLIAFLRRLFHGVAHWAGAVYRALFRRLR